MPVTFDQLTPGRRKPVIWTCKECGHSWSATVSNRLKGTGCPYCKGRIPIPGETDLVSKYPDVAKEWGAEENNGHMPSKYTRFSHYPAWWKCNQGHLYQMPIYRRSRGCGCSVCDGKKIVPGENDLATRAPHLAREWDYEGNESVTPEQVALHSNSKFGWVCGICGHKWKATPNNRAAVRSCPKCAGYCVDPDINSIEAINPYLAEQWDIQRNCPLTARDVAAYDNRDYYWICDNGHSWEASPANRNKGTGCPYCNGKLPVVGVNDFVTICPSAATEWHTTRNAGLFPENYLSNSHEEVWWQCTEGHEWKQRIYERANGSPCQYCKERLPIVGETDLATKCKNLVDYWDYKKNKKNPEEYFPDCTTRVWWRCEKGHSFRAPIREMALRWRFPKCERKRNAPWRK